MIEASPAPYVANVIAPHPGACFRYLADPIREGYPTRCPKPVAFRGVIVNPAGQRIAVGACAGHAPVLVERRPVS